jgi:hypothetical protein
LNYSKDKFFQQSNTLAYHAKGLIISQKKFYKLDQSEGDKALLRSRQIYRSDNFGQKHQLLSETKSKLQKIFDLQNTQKIKLN